MKASHDSFRRAPEYQRYKETFIMDDATTQLADRLLGLRRKAGYSQEQLADLLGVSRQAISKWEGAQGRPEVDNVVEFCSCSCVVRVASTYAGAVPRRVLRAPQGRMAW